MCCPIVLTSSPLPSRLFLPLPHPPFLYLFPSTLFLPWPYNTLLRAQVQRHAPSFPGPGSLVYVYAHMSLPKLNSDCNELKDLVNTKLRTGGSSSVLDTNFDVVLDKGWTPRGSGKATSPLITSIIDTSTILLLPRSSIPSQIIYHLHRRPVTSFLYVSKQTSSTWNLRS